MTVSLERDFIGYGARPPQADWPNGARIAVNFVLNYEEGSEYAIDLGDGLTDNGLIEVSGSSAVPHGQRDLAAESMFEYGSRVGFWRIHRLFAERGLPMTVFACALALERNREAAAVIAEAGYDLCCHGWRWVEHFKLSEDEERRHIARAFDSLKQTVGRPPEGWYCRYGPSENTRRLVVEHGGYLYDSDSYADELPFYVTQGGKPWLVLPYTLTNNDVKFPGAMLSSGESFFQMLRESFDMLHAEGASVPKMMNIGLHQRIVGHPGRASGLAKFLDYVQARPDVWVCRRADLARHWLATHPAWAAA